MEKRSVLFVCVHNSARSQMAEAWANHLCGDFFSSCVIRGSSFSGTSKGLQLLKNNRRDHGMEGLSSMD